MNKLLVVYFNFDSNPEESRLLETASKFGYEIRKIGEGKSFINFRQAKIDVLLEDLHKVEHEYVCFTNGLDSWFLNGDLFKTYKKYFKNKVVVSGNRDHYPSSDLYDISEFPETKDFRYICCSQFIGKTKDVIKTIETIRDSWNGFTDQEGWHYVYVKGLSNIEIDHKCRLFLNMTNVGLEELTNFSPCSIHWGGPKSDSPNGIAMREAWELLK